jgi:hypothetical protein
MRETPVLLSEVLHKNDYRKGSLAKKKNLVVILEGVEAKKSCLAVNL